MWRRRNLLKGNSVQKIASNSTLQAFETLEGFVRVFNQLGSLVGSWQYAVGSSLEQINISSFKPGFYFLVVKTEKGAETKTVIKHE